MVIMLSISSPAHVVVDRDGYNVVLQVLLMLLWIVMVKCCLFQVLFMLWIVIVIMLSITSPAHVVVDRDDYNVVYYKSCSCCGS